GYVIKNSRVLRRKESSLEADGVCGDRQGLGGMGGPEGGIPKSEDITLSISRDSALEK
ncbi:hypothetical protein L917_06456, partial [Phytophthora nicotianae]